MIYVRETETNRTESARISSHRQKSVVRISNVPEDYWIIFKFIKSDHPLTFWLIRFDIFIYVSQIVNRHV